jgi:hypothetical protein
MAAIPELADDYVAPDAAAEPDGARGCCGTNHHYIGAIMKPAGDRLISSRSVMMMSSLA